MDRNLISLGRNCTVKGQINTYLRKKKQSQPTYFFDWLMSDFTTVCQILDSNIDQILKREFIVENQQQPSHNNGKNARLIVNSVQRFESIHDVPANYSENDIDQFRQKYKRRYHTMMNLIKSGKKLYFISYKNSITDKRKNKFIEIIT